MMLIFAFFTLGYFAGVITALLMFPPKVKEIEMQEQDAAKPVAELEQSKNPQISPTLSRDLILEIRN